MTDDVHAASQVGHQPPQTPPSGIQSDLVILKEILDALIRSRWGIMSLIVLAILAALLVAFTLPPVYRATSTLVIKSNISRPIETVQNVYNPGAGQPGYYYTQFKIIKSRSVISQVVDKLDLVDNPAFADVVKPPAQYDWKQWVPFLPAQDTPPKTDKQKKQDQRERVISEIRSKLLHVVITPGSKLVDVGVDSKDPALAATMANAVVEAYIQRGLHARLHMAKHFSGWLGKRLTKVKQNLADAQQALHEFKKKENLVDLGKAGSVLQAQLSSNMAQLRQARVEMTKLGGAYHKIKQAGSDPTKLEAVSTLLSDPTVRSAKNGVLQAKSVVDSLSSRYGPKHPKMIRAQASLQAAKQSYHQQLMTAAAGVRAKYEVAQHTAHVLSGVEQQARQKIQTVGGKSYKLNVLQRNVQANQELYNTFLQRVKQTSTMGDYHAVLAQQIDKATEPHSPYKPRKKFIVVVAAVMGLLLGLVLALLRYFLVDVIRSTEELEKATGLSVFGVLPLFKKKRSVKVELNDSSLSGFAEGIRSIRTGLQLSDMAGRKQVVMMTSANPAEGKTTSALNLASACGQLERVLLIDADLRKPALAKRLKLKGDNGLVELLAGQADKADCIRHYEKGGIDILPVMKSPPNAAEIAGTPRFEAMIRELSQDYDRIIVDSSPCLAVSDPLLLSRVCDAVLLVVKVEQTRRRSIQRTLRQLESAHAHVLGVVANQVEKSRKKDYYYGYYSYYGYGS